MNKLITQIHATQKHIDKKKYWYATDVYCCVLCGRETKYRQRVYNENEKGIEWHDDVCWEHKL